MILSKPHSSYSILLNIEMSCLHTCLRCFRLFPLMELSRYLSDQGWICHRCECEFGLLKCKACGLFKWHHLSMQEVTTRICATCLAKLQ